jgi:hypothetical protein
MLAAGGGSFVSQLWRSLTEALAVVAAIYGSETGVIADFSTTVTAYQAYSLPTTPLWAPPYARKVPGATVAPPSVDTSTEGGER